MSSPSMTLRSWSLATLLGGSMLLGCPEPLDGEPARTSFSLQGAHADADCISCHGGNANWARCVDYEGGAIQCSETCEDCHARPGGHLAVAGSPKAVASCDDAGCHENFDAWFPLVAP